MSLKSPSTTAPSSFSNSSMALKFFDNHSLELTAYLTMSLNRYLDSRKDIIEPVSTDVMTTGIVNKKPSIYESKTSE